MPWSQRTDRRPLAGPDVSGGFCIVSSSGVVPTICSSVLINAFLLRNRSNISGSWRVIDGQWNNPAGKSGEAAFQQGCAGNVIALQLSGQSQHGRYKTQTVVRFCHYL